MTGGIHVAREGDGVVVLELDNPPMNAMDAEMLRVFSDTLTEIESDMGIRCLVLIGRGRAFCVGEDLKELSASGEELKSFMALTDRLGATRVPTIAAINGFCIGGGLEIALVSDICIASEKAVFVCAGVNMGGLSEPYLLVQRVGVGNAKEMLFTGDQYRAATALRMGLVSQVVPADDLRSTAINMAKRIATRAPLSAEATKRITGKCHLPPEDYYPLYWQELLGVIRAEDLQEGIASFKERREPAFKRR